MGIIERFRAAVGATAVPEDSSPAQLPIRLSKACVEVLPVVGAGLSLFSGPTMRIPVGASDPISSTAERLQFTVADGPCFAANRTGRLVVAPATVIAERWPLFYDQLITHTPIRGVVSTPLSGGLAGVGVLDLYVHNPADLNAISVDDVEPIIRCISDLLTAEPMFPQFRSGPPWDVPLWSGNPPAGARGNVMIAMGLVSVALGLCLEDALAALRAHAFTVGATVDDTASDIVQRTLPATALATDSNS